MSTLIFLGTVITILVLLVKMIVWLFQKKNVLSTLRTMGIIILGYAILWLIFYFTSSLKTVPLGTDICFDDWCATITAFEKSDSLGKENHISRAKGQYIILFIKMSNHARGIAQKPSEPEVHIIDDKGNYLSFSEGGQQALEEMIGKQIPIDSRLELHQSLETRMVFDVPAGSIELKAIIEEGPFITKLLLKESINVFSLQ
jgi:hypothetical protein